MTVGVGRIERAGYAAWSPEETTTINGWSVAANRGFTRRLNSATAHGIADTSLQTSDAIRGWLGERGASLTIRATPLIDTATLGEVERTWGLESVDETVVMTAKPSDDAVQGNIEFVHPGDDAYVDDLFTLNGRTDAVRLQWDRIVDRIEPLATGLWIPGDAVGFVAIHDRIASLFSFAVRPSVRRQGIATAMVSAAASWATARDAEVMFLQVLGTNTPARRLYERLGFVEAYRYHYLQVAAADGNATEQPD